MKKDILAQKLEQQLQAVAGQRLAAKREPSLLAARTALKQYQAARLTQSHADLLADPNTRDAALFFFDELYGAHDLSQRDVDLGRIIPTMQKVLTYETLNTITDAIVLDALSEQLDTAMARALGPQFTDAMYLAAYRTATTREDRARQLQLVQELGDSLCGLIKIPLLSVTLSIMKGPAKVAGLMNLHLFLERGFGSFKKMRTPRVFVTTVVTRERQWMDDIFAGRLDTFQR